MDFAKKQLEKYGWQEGKGLGKGENGISAPVKPKLKFDNAGLGHDTSEPYTNNWWEKLYDMASKNLDVTTAANGNVAVKVNCPDAVEITTKSYSLKNLKKKTNGLEYGSFIKTSKLTESGVVDFDNNFFDAESHNAQKVATHALTDDELFAACGGRTAHKGARHGVTQSGKLSRLEKQERLLLKKLKKVSLTDETDNKQKNLEKKLKKISNHKGKQKLPVLDEDMSAVPSGSESALSSSPHKHGKRRKKERKRVCFSEVVIEYQPQDPDPGEGGSADLDEGIDCSDFEATKERDASLLQVKIKEENKKMKRNLMKLRKKEEEVASKPLPIFLKVVAECSKCMKRKLKEEVGEVIEIKKCHYECQPSKDKESDKLLHSTKRELERQERRLEKRINRVCDSLNQVCKISDESE